MTISRHCEIALPAWVEPWRQERNDAFSDETACMAFVLDLARENVRMGTGGPFSAAVFDTGGQTLVSVGVNLVTSTGLSLAHAEMVALSLAQRRLADWDLAKHGELTLFSSCEPCAMCFGAIPWSGVRALVCGARKADAEAAGFDEGDKPEDWAGSLQARGIRVVEGVLSERAAEVFRYYRECGGEIYNPSGGD